MRFATATTAAFLGLVLSAGLLLVLRREHRPALARVESSASRSVSGTRLIARATSSTRDIVEGVDAGASSAARHQRLHVLSPEGTPLEAVRVVRTMGGAGRVEGGHPGSIRAASFLIAGAASPVELPEQVLHARGDLWVGAPGWTWAPLRAEEGAEERDLGERRVVLEPGADLRLTFTGDRPRDPLRLTLRHSGSQEALVWSDGLESMLELEGLRPGRWELDFELDPEEARESTVTRALELEAGSPTVVLLPYPVRAIDARQPIRGVVHLEEEDATPGLLEALRVVVYPLREDGQRDLESSREKRLVLRPAPGGGHAGMFTTRALPLGPYEVELSPLGLVQGTFVSEDGGEVSFSVPPLAHTLIDLRSPLGAPIPAPRLRAWWRKPSGLMARLVAVERPEMEGLEVLSLPGQLTVSHGLDGLHPGTLTQEVQAGWNLLSTELSRGFTVRLQSFQGERAFPLAASCWIGAAILDERGEVLECERLLEDVRVDGVGGMRFTVAEPGRYQVLLPALRDRDVTLELEVAADTDGVSVHPIQIPIVPQPTPDGALR